MSQQRKTLFITLGAVCVVILAVMLISGNGAPPGPPGAPSSANATKPETAGTENGNEKTQQAAPAGRMPGAGQQQTTTIPEVGVVSVAAKSHKANVEGYGQVNPRFNLTLSAQVSGQVQSPSKRFETGAQFNKGDVLATIDNTDYEQAVAAAQATLEDAKVALEEERLQGQQALSEWQRSGLEGEPSSSLVLRGPQLAAAEATVAQAEKALAQAQRDLAFTQITSPFNSVVVTRSIQPGSFVQSGAEVAALYATNVAEIAIPLSATQWNNLPSPATLKQTPWPVTLTDMDGLTRWEGVVERVEQHLDTTSRQRSAIVVVNDPLAQASPLYFGTYVVAEIAGREWQDVWQIPSSAISQKQEVWYVTQNNTLDKFTPQVLFMENGHAYITPVAGMESAKVVVRPLNSYLVNMKVNPVAEVGNGGE